MNLKINNQIEKLKRIEKYIFSLTIVFLSVFFAQNDNIEKKYLMVMGMLIIGYYFIIGNKDIMPIPYPEFLLLLLFCFYSIVEYEGNVVIYIPTVIVIFSCIGYYFTLYGSNKRSEYIVASLVVGYCFHMFMNTIVLFYTKEAYRRVSKDYLSGGRAPATQHVIYCIPALCLVFLFFKFKNKVLKFSCLIISVIGLIFGFLSGTRMQVCILLVLLCIYMLLDIVINKNKRLAKIAIGLLIGLVVVCAFIFIFIQINAFNIKQEEWYKNLICNFSRDGGILHNIRFRNYYDAIIQMPKYPYGGRRMLFYNQHIGNQIDFSIKMPGPVHNIWLDMYNAQGFLPFILLVVYTSITYYDLIKFVRNKKISTNLRLFVFGLFIAFHIYYFFEPAFDASYQFIIPWIFLDGYMRAMNDKTKLGGLELSNNGRS